MDAEKRKSNGQERTCNMPIQIRVIGFYLRLIVRPMESTLLWLCL
jgi:hypothetical protein